MVARDTAAFSPATGTCTRYRAVLRTWQYLAGGGVCQDGTAAVVGGDGEGEVGPGLAGLALLGRAVQPGRHQGDLQGEGGGEPGPGQQF